VRRILALFLVVGAASAQSWYYNVDQVNSLSPATVVFEPTPTQILCAGLLEPGVAPTGVATVSFLTFPTGCPAAPPVVVYGADPASGDPVYASVFTAKFWGRRQASHSSFGYARLIRLLKRSYALRVQASGDLGLVDDQFLPPFATPPAGLPPLAGTWYSWQGSQTISLGDPQVANVQNHPRSHSICRYLYNERCWSALLIWVLPVRLVLHGDETGSAQITLTPGFFVRRTAATLAVRGDEFEVPEVKPFGP